MALKPCKECKKEISSEAPTCPHCGVKNPVPPEPRKKSSFVFWAIGTVVILGAIGQSLSNQRAADVEKNTPKKTDAEKAKANAALQFAGLGAMQLKKAAKDPTAFELTSFRMTDDGATCYEYRAKNSFGAVLPGEAVQTPAGKLLTREQHGATFGKAWNTSCVKPAVNMVEQIKRSGILDD